MWEAFVGYNTINKNITTRVIDLNLDIQEKNSLTSKPQVLAKISIMNIIHRQGLTEKSSYEFDDSCISS